MSSPVGRLAARVDPTTRQRILLGTLISAVVVYELNAVADDDSVKGDSISATNRWLYDKVEGRIGPTAAQISWMAAIGTVAIWYAGHILKPVVDSVTN